MARVIFKQGFEWIPRGLTKGGTEWQDLEHAVLHRQTAIADMNDNALPSDISIFPFVC